ncbi:MAG TPA: NAD(P)-dependent oxidoreductase [Candidatus Saccharimonadales bacterium]|nr:NAD(P)-dependent oxidoreductase [Candidatus Saccharimonadales bacterium]
MTKQKTVLLTGGSGFFGSILKKRLLKDGYKVVSIDLEKDDITDPNLVSIQGDIRDRRLLNSLGREYQFAAIFHIAAILAHAVKDKKFLWTSNVDGTRNIAGLARKYHIPKILFTSSNCLWGESFNRPVREDDQPKPVEIYGLSKWEGEKILLEKKYRDSFKAIIVRCPTIVDAGRLGLLAILFEFIDEGRKVWVVGGGKNRYQFIYADDLVEALLKGLRYNKSEVFNIGSDDVPTFVEAYNYVIKKAGTNARVANLPRSIVIPLMKIAYALKISPLGPYQYNMIAESFVFDTDKIKQDLEWKPTLTNQEMLYKAYRYYHEHLSDIKHRTDVSAHKQAAKMGIIKLLKWIS